MSETSRLIGAIKAIVRAALVRVDFFALYSARVVTQSGDGSLEVLPDDPRIPGMSNVRIKVGIPGVVARVVPGASVMVGFDGGDPGAPYACLFDAPQSLQSLTITATTTISISASAQVTVSAPSVVLAPGGRPVARVGDPVTVVSPGAPTVLVPGTPLVGTIVAGNPQVLA